MFESRRTPSEELIQAVQAGLTTDYGDEVSYRVLAHKKHMPEGLIAAMSRVARNGGVEGVTLDEENRLRPYFGLELLVNTRDVYDISTHRIVKRVADTPRPKRISTDFHEDTYRRFQVFRDSNDLTNNEAMTALLDLWHREWGELA